MNGLDQYLAVALNRSIDHSPVLAWLIGTVCDLPSLKMLPLGAMWFSGSAQSTRAPNSIADSHWGSSGAHRLTAYSGHRALSPPTDAFEVAGICTSARHRSRMRRTFQFVSQRPRGGCVALSAGIYVWRRSLGVVAIVWPVITTCFARVYVGYHYPTDVVVGTLLGIATTWAAGMMPVTAPLCREQS